MSSTNPIRSLLAESALDYQFCADDTQLSFHLIAPRLISSFQLAATVVGDSSLGWLVIGF